MNLRRFSEIYYPPRKLSINSAGAARETIIEQPICDILRLLFLPCRIPLDLLTFFLTFELILALRHACHSVSLFVIFSITIFALSDGAVQFKKGKSDRTFVHIVAPAAQA